MKYSRYITGIYNYCDYWCERCAFTRRCRNFAMGKELEQEDAGVAGDSDSTQKAFWDKLAAQIRETSIVGEATVGADEVRFDPDLDVDLETGAETRRQAVRSHPLVLLSQTYREKASAWLETADVDLKTAAEELLQSARTPFREDDAEEEAREIGDLIEVVTWYHTLIPSKLSRAVHGLIDIYPAEGEAGDIIRASRRDDANGTGKLALVSIERSMAAWIRLREVVPSREDDILEMLALLGRMQQGIHASLPGVKAFIRPGFDQDLRSINASGEVRP
jgi:hypothetical protein